MTTTNKRALRLLALLLAVLIFGCSAESADSPPEPLVFELETPLTFCLDGIEAADSELTSEIWGVTFACPGFDVWYAEDPTEYGLSADTGGWTNGEHILITGAAKRHGRLPIVLAHEIGHVLGFEHPCDSQESCGRCEIMSPYATWIDPQCFEEERASETK